MVGIDFIPNLHLHCPCVPRSRRGGMKSYAWWLFGLAGLFNFAVGGAILFARPSLVEMFGLDTIGGSILVFANPTGMFVVLFGYAYLQHRCRSRNLSPVHPPGGGRKALGGCLRGSALVDGRRAGHGSRAGLCRFRVRAAVPRLSAPHVLPACMTCRRVGARKLRSRRT